MVQLVTLRARPDLRPQIYSAAFRAAWPPSCFTTPRRTCSTTGPPFDACLDTAFAVVDPAQPDVAVGRAFAVPFAFGGAPDRVELPDAGCDGMVRWGWFRPGAAVRHLRREVQRWVGVVQRRTRRSARSVRQRRGADKRDPSPPRRISLNHRRSGGLWCR
jgi:hypothetical protein